MTVYRTEADLPTDSAGRHTGNIIEASLGATQGFCLGVGYYDSDEFGPMGVHDDQEAIYVLEGAGTASVGGQQFAVGPGTAFFVAPKVPHTIKRDHAGGPVKVLWTHGAI
jgi:mannose-6-phosphate isomerase-like protein (cupin superfamily)